MSNANSVAGWSQSGSTRNQFPTQTVSVATETQLTITADTGTAALFLALPWGATAMGAFAPMDTNANPAIIRRTGREYRGSSGESSAVYSSATWDGHPFKVRMAGIGNAAAQLAAPVNDTFTTAATGGTLADSTPYYYRVAAVNAQGGTSLASTETSITTSGLGGGLHTVTVKWLAVAGAVTYNVYGRTTGGELLMAAVTAPTLQWVDTGSVTPAGALPAATTSNVTLKLYQGTTTLNSAIGTSGAIAIATAGGAFNFEIEATLLWDSGSGVLSGWYTSNTGYGSSSHIIAPTVVTTVTAGLTTPASLSFAGSATFGFASASNTITLRDFCAEKL